MGGIKSKIFSDWSLENPDLETDLTADEKSKMMITNEKLNLNDFEYYVIDQDDQGVNQNQTLNEQTHSTKFMESGTVKVQVKNIGLTKGKEVVQLYYKDLVASITPSVKKLMGFSKIELASFYNYKR